MPLNLFLVFSSLSFKKPEPRFFRQEDSIYVLFNAWCQKDSVYMQGDVEKNEYVLNDTGYVFTGTSRKGQQYARPWVFGQFEDTVTEVVFDILRSKEVELSIALRMILYFKLRF